MSNYPNALDTDLELPRVDDNITEIGGDSINSLREAIFAIQQSIGLEPQGNLATMVARVNEVIDENGNLQLSALEGRGLVSLPINDSHIDDNAAIAETKIDLDYGTSVLNSKIAQNTSDLDSLRVAFNASVNDFIKHINAVATRHDGYDVDLNVSVRGGTTVEAGLHIINDAFTNHETLSTDVHDASAISTTNNFNRINATNVQTALEGLDAIDPGIEEHQDKLHDTAVVINNSVESGQASTNISTFATTIYQTDKTGTNSPDGIGGVTNIVQVMQPNTARVTSSGIDMRALEVAVADKLRIQAGGISRGPLDVDLASVVGSTDVDLLAKTINTAARFDHYPVAAYNTGGELTIAHNIWDDGYTVQILDTITNSADTVLGFGDIVGTTFEYTGSEHSAYIGGKKVFGLKELLKIENYDHTTATDLNRIAPGLGDLNNYGISSGTDEGRVIVHLTDHSTDDAYNGTYYIQSFFGSDEFDLNANIPQGTFALQITSDSVNFSNSTRGEIHNIFIENSSSDGYGVIVKEEQLDYLPISGLHIREVSSNFSTDNPKWSFTSDEELVIRTGPDLDPILGPAVKVSSGFTGQLRVYAADGSSALIEVLGTPSVLNNRAITSSSLDLSDDKLLISSVHYSDTTNADNKTVQFPHDKRKFGVTKLNDYKDKFNPTPVDDAFGELRSNGVVRGLDVDSNTTTTIRIRGGRALVDGSFHDVVNQDITIYDFTSGTHLLVLDSDGKFQTITGDNLTDINNLDAYGDNRSIATITEFTTNGSAITGGFVDRRLLLDNLDTRLVHNIEATNSRITQIESSFGGNMWGSTEVFSSDGAGTYLGTLDAASNSGFTALDGTGFGGGPTDDRRYEFDDFETIKETIFRPTGMTHVNIFAEANYTDSSGSDPFGTSGEVIIHLGVKATVGVNTTTETEGYAEVKTINTTVFPTADVSEMYVASIPLDLLGISTNGMFDIHTRVKITGSVLIDGGSGSGTDPQIEFGKVRVVTSTYSIAGSVSGQDGSSVALGTSISDVL